MKRNDTIFYSIIILLVAITISSGIFIYRTEKAKDAIEQIVLFDEYLIKPITSDDHILGNPDADVIWIEYSDFKCPYCREFHPTIKRALSEFGGDGRLAWVYRHFPAESAITGEDSLSKTTSIAAECVADIAGEKKFWEFVSGVYEKLPINFSADDLEKFVAEIEIDINEYNACLKSGKFEDKIQKSIEDGLTLFKFDKTFSTPYSVVITKSGKQFHFSGAESYNVIREIVNTFSLPKSL